MNRKKEIIDMIAKISGKYSAYEIFSDWVTCCALCISNSCSLIQNKVWKVREQRYIDIMKKYDNSEQICFAKMLAMLAETFEEIQEDVLGGIYMESGMGSKAAGQFFTPYHISLLCASMTLPEPSADGKYYINEPACGGGGMIIAAAQALKEQGINYQRIMEVVAQDLDWKGVYMCYLQLSLLGISATVIQGDTLTEPYNTYKTPSDQILYTPMKVGMLL